MKKYFFYFIMLFIIVLPISAIALPTISGLPDLSLNQNDSLDNAIDLWAYSSDLDDFDSLLVFSIIGDTSPESGVSIDASRYIDINPDLNWIGYSDVSIQVLNTSGDTDSDTFRVTVAPVPEPATMFLLGTGLVSLAGFGRKKFFKK